MASTIKIWREYQILIFDPKVNTTIWLWIPKPFIASFAPKVALMLGLVLWGNSFGHQKNLHFPFGHSKN
jgi:hypothetical protein